MKLLNLLCPSMMGCLMLMTASNAFAQSQTSLTIIIAQTQGICDTGATSYLDQVDSASDINTEWNSVALIGICTKSNDGFDLSISSLRGGNLQVGTNTQYQMPYSVKSVCVSQTTITPTKTDVCNIDNLIINVIDTPESPQGTKTIFSTAGCPTGPGGGICRSQYVQGFQVGVKVKIDDSVKSTTYPSGTYTDTIYYSLQAN